MKAGKRNFIYTHSGKTVYEYLDKWGLSPYITFVLDSTYNFPNKPDPSALQYLLARFDMDPATALMIGDRDNDVLGAARHGIDCAGVLWGFGSREELLGAGAKHLCALPHDLLPLF